MVRHVATIPTASPASIRSDYSLSSLGHNLALAALLTIFTMAITALIKYLVVQIIRGWDQLFGRSAAAPVASGPIAPAAPGVVEPAAAAAVALGPVGPEAYGPVAPVGFEPVAPAAYEVVDHAAPEGVTQAAGLEEIVLQSH